MKSYWIKTLCGQSRPKYAFSYKMQTNCITEQRPTSWWFWLSDFYVQVHDRSCQWSWLWKGWLLWGMCRNFPDLICHNLIYWFSLSRVTAKMWTISCLFSLAPATPALNPLCVRHSLFTETWQLLRKFAWKYHIKAGYTCVQHVQRYFDSIEQGIFCDTMHSHREGSPANCSSDLVLYRLYVIWQDENTFVLTRAFLDTSMGPVSFAVGLLLHLQPPLIHHQPSLRLGGKQQWGCRETKLENPTSGCSSGPPLEVHVTSGILLAETHQ